MELDAKNADDLFRRAKRVWGDGLALWYWGALCDRNFESDDAKFTVAALSSDETVGAAVEQSAKELIDIWRKKFNGQIGRLKDAKRAAFYDIWQQAKSPELIQLIMPSHIVAPMNERQYQKHLYAKNGQFPVVLTGWETAPLERELATRSLLAWYRNPSAGTRAVAVPYTQSGHEQTMYPDLIFFHRGAGDEVLIDIVDPHRPDKADAAPKWLGLSRFARRHRNEFRRVLAVIAADDGRLQSLDLKNPSVSSALEKATTEVDIRRIFEDFGGWY